jgi:mannose-1-phosphate guanylyltransferase
MSEKLKDEIPKINPENIIIETEARNTGPAMCLEVCYLEKFCSKDDIIASLPSDDYISNKEVFSQLLNFSEEFLKKNPEYIITPAVKPSLVDIGYSYFKIGEKLKDNQNGLNIYKVGGVAEKPSEDYCQKLVDSGEYYCHTGMYIWQLGNIIDLFKKIQPTMYETCSKIVDLMIKKADFDSIKNLYATIEKMSIESAITDKTDLIAMSVADNLGWSDLGKWHIIKRILKNDENNNLIKGEVVINESSNNLVYNIGEHKKIIALNDVSDLVVVDTGDTLFISSLKKSEMTKKIVEILKQEKKDQFL